MAATPLPLIAAQQLTNAAAIYYTSTNIRTRIDKMTFTNIDTAPHTVTVYLVAASGSPADANTITKARALAAGETWTCSDMIGQMLNAGGTIQAKADAGTVVNISAAGTQLS